MTETKWFCNRPDHPIVVIVSLGQFLLKRVAHEHKVRQLEKLPWISLVTIASRMILISRKKMVEKDLPQGAVGSFGYNCFSDNFDFQKKMVERGLPREALQGGRTHPSTLLETCSLLLQSIQCFLQTKFAFSEFAQNCSLSLRYVAPCNGLCKIIVFLFFCQVIKLPLVIT